MSQRAMTAEERVSAKPQNQDPAELIQPQFLFEPKCLLTWKLRLLVSALL